MVSKMYSPLRCNVCLNLKIAELKDAYSKGSDLGTVLQNLSNDYAVTASFSGAEGGGDDKPNALLMTCGGCCMVLYCSEEHQRLDWPEHKDLCESMIAIKDNHKVAHPMQHLNKVGDSSLTLSCGRLQMLYKFRVMVKRLPTDYEREVIMFCNHCALCFGFNGFKPCKDCMGVSYCTEDHAQIDASLHVNDCRALKAAMHPLQTLNNILKFNAIEEQIKINEDVYVDLNDTTDLGALVQKFLAMELPKDPFASVENYTKFRFVSNFSHMATMCLGLNHAGLKKANRSQMVIFIVGATYEPMQWFTELHTKLFFMQFPQVKHLNLYFIGPEVKGNEDVRRIFYKFKGDYRSVYFSINRKLFEDFCHINKELQPDLIAAFNVDFAADVATHLDIYTAQEMNIGERLDVPVGGEWSDGIKQMLRNLNCPILFTGNNKMHCFHNLCVLDDICKWGLRGNCNVTLKIFLNVTPNPFRDLHAKRCLTFLDEEEICYQNGYVAGVVSKVA